MVQNMDPTVKMQNDLRTNVSDLAKMTYIGTHTGSVSAINAHIKQQVDNFNELEINKLVCTHFN